MKTLPINRHYCEHNVVRDECEACSPPSEQIGMFTPAPKFKGDDYVPSRDEPRLLKQFDRVWNVMKDGAWHTIADVSKITVDPPQSVARQIRYIRSPKRGGYDVERRHDGGGLYSFRVVT